MATPVPSLYVSRKDCRQHLAQGQQFDIDLCPHELKINGLIDDLRSEGSHRITSSYMKLSFNNWVIKKLIQRKQKVIGLNSTNLSSEHIFPTFTSTMIPNHYIDIYFWFVFENFKKDWLKITFTSFNQISGRLSLPKFQACVFSPVYFDIWVHTNILIQFLLPNVRARVVDQSARLIQWCIAYMYLFLWYNLMGWYSYAMIFYFWATLYL